MSTDVTLRPSPAPLWETIVAAVLAALAAIITALAGARLGLLLTVVILGGIVVVALIRFNPVWTILAISLVRAPMEGLVGVTAGTTGGVDVDPVDALSIAFVLGVTWWLIYELRRGAHPLRLPMVKPALLFALLAGFSLLYTPGFILGTKDLGKLMAVFAAYMVLQIRRPTPTELRGILWMAALSAPWPILYGWYQFFQGIGLNFEAQGGLRIQSLFSHPNTYGLYLVAVLVACWGLRDQYRGWRRVLAWGIAIAALTALPLPLSRTAWLALGVVVLVVGYKHRWIWWSILTAGFGVVIFLPRTLERVVNVADTVETLGGASSLEIRLDFWSSGWRLWLEKPLQGQGWGGFQQITEGFSHNDYLRCLTELGPLGLILFVWLMGALVKSAYVWTKGRTDFPLAFFGLALSYPVVAAFTNSFEKTPYQWYFWVLAGAAAVWSEVIPPPRRDRAGFSLRR